MRTPGLLFSHYIEAYEINEDTNIRKWYHRNSVIFFQVIAKIYQPKTIIREINPSVKINQC